MVGVLSYTLLADGTSDRSLMRVIDWLLREHIAGVLPDGALADNSRLAKSKSFVERIARCVEVYPCEVLFIHRDAESVPPADRIREITEAVEAAKKQGSLPHHVCIVPVRMQEAWFLFDKAAIRRAAGNPNGKLSLKLPALKSVESIPDPKNTLYMLLKTASELRGRRLADFHSATAAVQVADHIQDFSSLRVLNAFQTFEADVQALASTLQ